MMTKQAIMGMRAHLQITLTIRIHSLRVSTRLANFSKFFCLAYFILNSEKNKFSVFSLKVTLFNVRV